MEKLLDSNRKSLNIANVFNLAKLLKINTIVDESVSNKLFYMLSGVSSTPHTVLAQVIFCMSDAGFYCIYGVFPCSKMLILGNYL